MAPRLAFLAVSVVFAGLGAGTFLHVVQAGATPGRLVPALPCLGTMVVLQLAISSTPPHELRSRAGFVALAAQAVLAFVPILYYDKAWTGMTGFFAGSVLLVSRGPLRWAVFTVVVVGMGVVGSVRTGGMSIVIPYEMVVVALTGLQVFGLSMLRRLVAERERARSEFDPEAAIEAERRRFNRDLHDLLERSLLAILVKAELVRRLACGDRARAVHELGEILNIARKALADLRGVASRYRRASRDEPAPKAAAAGRPHAGGITILTSRPEPVSSTGFPSNGAIQAGPPVRSWRGVLASITLAALAFVSVAVLGDPLVALPGFVVGSALLIRLRSPVEELREARAELTELAVTRERLRFSRDLHDLLGYSLAAITLKSELAYRLIAGKPDQARAEMAEIIGTSRQALADVRTVASSYRSLSLLDEAEYARDLLTAAGIRVTLHLDRSDLPPDVRTTLATVLREGVTNLLRHSKAERCEITLVHEANVVRMEIANDGAATSGAHRDGGSGIGNLHVRVREAGGTLAAGRTGPDSYQLRAEIVLR